MSVPPDVTEGPSISFGELRFDLTAAELTQRAGQILERLEHDLVNLVAIPGPWTVSNFLAPLDRILIQGHDVSAHGKAMSLVHPDEETRSAGRRAQEAGDRFYNNYLLNEGVNSALRSLDLGREDEPTKYAVFKMLRDMRRAGVDRDSTTRADLLGLSNVIDRTCNQYNENIAKGERSVVVDGSARLAGLPADYLDTHPPDSEGKIRITTRYPDVFPVLRYGKDPDLRRRLRQEFSNIAYPENVVVLSELLAARHRFALTLGYPSYASFALEDKMMARPEAARVFLERLYRLLRAPAERELARCLQRKQRDFPDSARLELWDGDFGGGYYMEKIRSEELGVDLKALRAYLPYPRVRDGLFQLCAELFGLSFRPAPSAPVWHATVEAYDAYRGPDFLGRFYLDLVPRIGKFNHAANMRIRYSAPGIQTPQSALVCNFLSPGTPPEKARMEHSDVVTFFHEFGHLIHALMSGHNRWLSNASSFVELDFIEAPSQLFEEWARDPDTLARFAKDPDTGASVPVVLLRRPRASEALGRASGWSRQLGLALASLELYDGDPTGMDISETYRASVDHFVSRPLEENDHLETSFWHITGYSACYYTYAWSAVIARDLVGPFFERGSLTDPEVAQRYAREILAPGSSRPAAESIRAYLGRDFDFAAFEQWIEESSTR
jgi:thimet oligopeptidase